MNTAAAPAPATLSGVEYQIKPLSDQAFESLTLWCRAHFLKSVRLSLEEETNQEKYDSTMKLSFETSLGIEWDSELGQKLLNETRGGIARMLFESILPTCPKTTMALCMRLMQDENNRAEFWQAFEIANDLIGVESSEKKNTP